MNLIEPAFKPFPHIDTFWQIWERSLLKTLWVKEKLLVQAIFPFPTMFCSLSKTEIIISVTFNLSSANAFNLVWSKILSCGNVLKTTFITSLGWSLNKGYTVTLLSGRQLTLFVSFFGFTRTRLGLWTVSPKDTPTKSPVDPVRLKQGISRLWVPCCTSEPCKTPSVIIYQLISFLHIPWFLLVCHTSLNVLATKKLCQIMWHHNYDITSFDNYNMASFTAEQRAHIVIYIFVTDQNCNFYALTSIDRRHIVFGLPFFCLFVRINFYMGHNFWMVSDRAFIFHIKIPRGKAFS